MCEPRAARWVPAGVAAAAAAAALAALAAHAWQSYSGSYLSYVSGIWLALGAAAAALGTAFLACPESGASPPYKEAVLARRDADETTLTRAFSGRWARGIRNRFTEALAAAPVLPYPLQNSMTADLRREAAKAGKPDLLSLWAGQGVPLARARPAGDLLRDLVRETEEAVARLAGG